MSKETFTERLISIRYQPTTVGNMMIDPEGGYCSFEAVAILKKQLASRDAEVAELQDRIELYEKALILSWPNGATGHAFDYWNSARKQDNDRS